MRHSRRSIWAAMVLMGCSWTAARAQETVIFHDDFTTGSTLNGESIPGGTAEASFTSYDIASTKNATNSAIDATAGTMTLQIPGTTSGFFEAQAIFTSTPVSLATVGDRIRLQYTFTAANNILSSDLAVIGTGSGLYTGLYNSGGVKPYTTLDSSGLSATEGSEYATGGTQLWQGYVSRVMYSDGVSSGSSAFITRPEQTGPTTSSQNQDLLFNNNGSGAYDNPTGTSLGGTGGLSLTPDQPYTLSYLVELTDASTFQLTTSLYDGVDTSGTELFTLSRSSGPDTFLTSTFDGLAIGYVYKGTSNGTVPLTINSITVSANGSAPPGPLVLDVGTGLTQSQAELGYYAISDAEAPAVQKTGGGTLVYDGYNTYTGPTTVSAGTLEVVYGEAVQATTVTVDTGATLSVASYASLHTPGVIVDGGTLSAATLDVNNTTGITSLALNAGTITGSPTVTITGGGQMSLVQDARVTAGIGSLSIDQAGGGGRLDVGAGEVTVAAGGISAADLRADLIAGRNGGAWNGTTGIISSTAAAAGGTRAVGYVVAGDGSARVSYAAPGDVDLSGQVNVFDLVSINSAGKYGAGSASVWSAGDFNYDGVTNVFDLVSIQSASVYGQ
ncbi:MAG: hypothetical protein RLZZ440_964, partial [Planctomycetota bacterium]